MAGDYDSLETWELIPDDWHDGADEITLRGRKESLESIFVMDSYAKEEE